MTLWSLGTDNSRYRMWSRAVSRCSRPPSRSAAQMICTRLGPGVARRSFLRLFQTSGPVETRQPDLPSFVGIVIAVAATIALAALLGRSQGAALRGVGTRATSRRDPFRL